MKPLDVTIVSKPNFYYIVYNLFVLQILIASRDSNSSISKLNKRRYIYVANLLPPDFAGNLDKNIMINYFLNCSFYYYYYYYYFGYRGWWTPLIFTATLGSLTRFFKHFLRHNSLTQARRNISRHYELVYDYVL